jgi:hypothetical protein
MRLIALFYKNNIKGAFFMKKSIFTLLVASIFALSFMVVGCKKAEEAKPEEEAAVEQPADEAAKTGEAIKEQAKDAAKDVIKKAVDKGVDVGTKKLGM